MDLDNGNKEEVIFSERFGKNFEDKDFRFMKLKKDLKPMKFPLYYFFMN